MLENIKHPNPMDIEWDKLIKKLSRSRLVLSNEDEETIKKIINKL